MQKTYLTAQTFRKLEFSLFDIMLVCENLLKKKAIYARKDEKTRVGNRKEGICEREKNTKQR